MAAHKRHAISGGQTETAGFGQGVVVGVKEWKGEGPGNQLKPQKSKSLKFERLLEGLFRRYLLLSSITPLSLEMNNVVN